MAPVVGAFVASVVGAFAALVCAAPLRRQFYSASATIACIMILVATGMSEFWLCVRGGRGNLWCGIRYGRVLTTAAEID